jgi:hypothetical protein
VFGDYGKLEASQRNVLRLMFSNSRVRSAQPDWESVARFVVAAFRAETARAGATEKVMALVDELCRLSPEFAKMWKDNEVRRHGDGTKQLRHPTAGLMPTGWSASFLPRIWMRPRSPTTQESAMSTKEVRSNEAAGSTSVANLDMKLEVVVIPVILCSIVFYLAVIYLAGPLIAHLFVSHRIILETKPIDGVT